MDNRPHIVRRAFKAGGEFFPTGYLVEDITTIKLFKIRVNERLLIPIPEDPKELKALEEYFWERFKLQLSVILAGGVSKGSEIAEPKDPDASEPPTPGTSEPQGGIIPDTQVPLSSDSGGEVIVPLDQIPKVLAEIPSVPLKPMPTAVQAKTPPAPKK